MTRFVVDATVVLYLASEEIEVSSPHKLLAPTLLRSQVLSTLHEAVQRGDLPSAVARGARASSAGRGRSGWASTYNAEYVALTEL